jgi:hypothetical protein
METSPADAGQYDIENASQWTLLSLHEQVST